MRVFIAGIMQGSLAGSQIVAQDYRERIRQILAQKYPQAQIIDPWALHPDSVDYGDEEARRAFLDMIDVAGQADRLVAYLPQASMGTALEMWRAYERGVPVFTISPLAENWVVRFLSVRVFPGLGEFAEFIAAGGLDGSIAPIEGQ